MESNTDLLKPIEAAAYLKISRAAIYALIQRGEIPYVRLSARTVRLSRSRLDGWLLEREQGGAK